MLPVEPNDGIVRYDGGMCCLSNRIMVLCVLSNRQDTGIVRVAGQTGWRYRVLPVRQDGGTECVAGQTGWWYGVCCRSDRMVVQGVLPVRQDGGIECVACQTGR